jgi:hypothetical protein
MSMMKRRMAAALAAALVAATLLPGVAMAAEKRVKVSRPDGRAPAKWDLPKPRAVPHPDVAPPTASGNGDGYNNISFGAFDNGDIVVVLGTSKNGVQRESCVKYRTYPEAYGLWVPGVDWLGASVRDYCRRQLGEPYNVMSSKSDETQWYCSKLAWAGWYRIASRDIDADGGYWVWPVDLVNSRWTSVLGHWV